MRRYLITLIIAAMAVLTALPADAQTDTLRRKKVGLVLSGGGAKGMAHIGVLHVLEKAGIPVDIITGTSMGALIGGLYSIGYDAATLDSLVMAQNWNSLLSDRVDIKGQSLAERDKQNTYILSRPLTIAKRVRNASGGLIVGTNLSKLFARLTMGWHDSIDFARLPIPFACVATDIATNTEHDFYGGYLQQAMRASMAIPGVFTPVRVDSMVLVDGGLRNNYPADIARQMGADVIIGVSVQSDDKTADELKSAPDILMQIVDINCKNKLEENWAMTDIPIKVNVKGYSSASFSQTAIDSLIERGEQAAMEHWSGLVMLKRSLGLADDYKPTRKTKSVPLQEALNVRVDTVEFENIEPADSRFVMTKYRLSGKDSIPVRRIEQAVTLLSNDFLYTGADYSLTKQREGYVLRMSAKDKRTSRVNLGVRFDTEETVALQANLTHQIKTRIPINTAFTGRLGKRMMARLDADINPLHYSKIGFTYELRHDDVNIYDRGDRAYSFTYNRHRLGFNVFSLDFRNISMDIGVKADFYDFHDVLTGSAGNNELSNEHLYSYHFNLNYNSEDKWFFTTRGAYFTAGFGYYTDNFISWKERGGISAVDALWRMSFSLNSRFTLQPMVYGRMLFGDNIPLIMRNALGGDVAGRYFEQQMPFAGVGHVEFIDDKLVACQLRAQQRIVDNNYVILKMSLAQRGETLKTMFDKGLIFGCEAAYYYNSMFGPIGASLGYSNRTNHPYLYVNLGFSF